MKGRALRRALGTNQINRIYGDVPLLTDSTEWVTPEMAYALLEKNVRNRTIRWNRVEELAAVMRSGDWRLHGQGILLDVDGNIITGQHRLWAIIYADRPVLLRICKGNPSDIGHLVDRGIPQSSRDLATRVTTKKHSPTEASIARSMLALRGHSRPSSDAIAHAIAENLLGDIVLTAAKGIKKTKSIIMILGAICCIIRDTDMARDLAGQSEVYAARFETALLPMTTQQCWGRGAAFQLAMKKAASLISKQQQEAL